MRWVIPSPVYDVYEWQDDALCRRVEPERFFHDDSLRRIEQRRREASAKRICQRCPVIQECLEHALQTEAHGIWGGTTPAERGRIRAARAARATSMSASAEAAEPA
ncbi:WhiB family redox-sensing transcriptional regulator [Knoellia remsis]|uniref:Transcriptional regulator WhiB n=1 Tax=Knoellia remsis TaxID=407159 RepID=A0A2T0UA40_9MICO|nr:WhiB family transcriptional regulator [Knoellia remsis]PRY54697.1 WhiB family redox-sensing transcriptional regulator [Knoellia remsis]